MGAARGGSEEFVLAAEFRTTGATDIEHFRFQVFLIAEDLSPPPIFVLWISYRRYVGNTTAAVQTEL